MVSPAEPLVVYTPGLWCGECLTQGRVEAEVFDHDLADGPADPVAVLEGCRTCRTCRTGVYAAEFQDALKKLADTMLNLGHIMSAQGAFGWMYRGDLDHARAVLAKLPPEVLQQVSVAASALSTLADEVAGEDKP